MIEVREVGSVMTTAGTILFFETIYRMTIGKQCDWQKLLSIIIDDMT